MSLASKPVMPEPLRWRDEFVALGAPGHAASQRTGEDSVWWVPIAVWCMPVIMLILIALFVPFGSATEPGGFGNFAFAMLFTGATLFTLFKFTEGLIQQRTRTISIEDRVVHGLAVNGFRVVVERWEDALDGHRIQPVRVLRRIRDRPVPFTVSDGPVEALGAAEIRLDHPSEPQRSVTLIREHNVPVGAPFPLSEEAARFAAHLGLPLAELQDQTEIAYRPPRTDDS